MTTDASEAELERGMLAVLERANLSQAEIDVIMRQYRERRDQLRALHQAIAGNQTENT